MKTTVLILILGAALMAVAQAEEPVTGPDEVTIDEISHWFGPVEFSHGDHADMIEDCAVCHHDQEPEDAGLCTDCHVAEYDPVEFETPELKMAYHLNCIGCHQEEDAPLACGDCHERLVLPEGVELLEARQP